MSKIPSSISSTVIEDKKRLVGATVQAVTFLFALPALALRSSATTFVSAHTLGQIRRPRRPAAEGWWIKLDVLDTGHAEQIDDAGVAAVENLM
jgi:hypothetical protein